MEIVLYRPVAARASFSAMLMASAPLGAKSTRPSGSGASSTSFFASATARSLV